MSTKTRFLLFLVVGLPAATGLFASEGADHSMEGMHHDRAMTSPAATAGETDAAWLAAAKAAYPLKACVVSGDDLEEGDMGKPVDYVYKAEGQPDRLVRFCCKDCVRDFKKDPAKYLAKIDAAVAKNAAGKMSDHAMGNAAHAEKDR